MSLRSDHLNDEGNNFGSPRAQLIWLVSMLQLKVVSDERDLCVCKRFGHFEVTSWTRVVEPHDPNAPITLLVALLVYLRMYAQISPNPGANAQSEGAGQSFTARERTFVSTLGQRSKSRRRKNMTTIRKSKEEDGNENEQKRIRMRKMRIRRRRSNWVPTQGPTVEVTTTRL